MKCWHCGTEDDVALVGPTEWCRSCFQKSWNAGHAIDNRPQTIVVSPKVERLILGAHGVVRICSLQDFVEHFGEGHPWHEIVTNWFCAGGRPIDFTVAEEDDDS